MCVLLFALHEVAGRWGKKEVASVRATESRRNPRARRNLMGLLVQGVVLEPANISCYCYIFRNFACHL